MDSDGHEKKGQQLYWDECYAIQGAVFEVYRVMGCGFLEAVYQECLEHEFICYGKIIVELQALKTLTLENESQLLNYLKATGMRVGLLANFGSHPKAVVKRFIF